MKIDTTVEATTIHILPGKDALVFSRAGKFYMPNPEFYIEKHTLYAFGKKITIWQRVMEGDAFLTNGQATPIDEKLILILASFVWEGVLNWVKGILKGVLSKLTPFSSLLQIELGGFSFSVGVRVAACA
jgi:hypothetical protein